MSNLRIEPLKSRDIDFRTVYEIIQNLYMNGKLNTYGDDYEMFACFFRLSNIKKITRSLWETPVNDECTNIFQFLHTQKYQHLKI